MRKFDDFLAEQRQDEEFAKEYEAIQPEMNIIRAMVDARISQNLTQKELAEKFNVSRETIKRVRAGVTYKDVV